LMARYVDPQTMYTATRAVQMEAVLASRLSTPGPAMRAMI
jgi:hypothetical protein